MSEEAPPRQPYYWEEGGDESVGWRERLRQNAQWAGNGVFAAMEFVGLVTADILGLNQSKFQYVIDAKERQEEEEAQWDRAARQRQALAPGATAERLPEHAAQ